MSNLTFMGTDKKKTINNLSYFLAILLLISCILNFIAGNLIGLIFKVLLLISIIMLIDAVDKDKYEKAKFFKVIYLIYITIHFIFILYIVFELINRSTKSDEYYDIFDEMEMRQRKENGRSNNVSVFQLIFEVLFFAFEVYYYRLSTRYIEKKKNEQQNETNMRNLEGNTEQTTTENKTTEN